MNATIGSSGDGVLLLGVSVGILTALVHLVFALGVHADAGRFVTDGGRLAFAPRWGWTLATVATGLLALAIYWLIHRSSLAKPDGGMAEQRDTA